MKKREEAFEKALKDIRTNLAGYSITKDHSYSEAISDMWHEVQRMDAIARRALCDVYPIGTHTEANGVGDTTESAAPAWVIDMIRTGKPVRCRVWDDIFSGKDVCYEITSQIFKLFGYKRQIAINGEIGIAMMNDHVVFMGIVETLKKWKDDGTLEEKCKEYDSTIAPGIRSEE